MNEPCIGWATRDVSTTKPISIPGQFHTRISQGVFDPVTLTTLVLDNGVDHVVFLSADVVIFRSYMLDRIRELVAPLCDGLAPEKILMSATHTHTGPSTYGDKVSAPQAGLIQTSLADCPRDGVETASNDEYFNFFASQAADAVQEAWNGRKPGGLAYGYGYAVVAHSRRAVYFDDVSKRPGAIANSTHAVNGHAQMYGNTNDAQFSHYEAGTDAFINLLYTFDHAGALTGALVNVPCPSQNSEGACKLSASFWHEARENIRKQHGNIFILPQCAASGDLAPRILHYKAAQERRFRLKYGADPEPIAEWHARRDIGERIAQAFTETLAWAQKDIQSTLPITHVVHTVHLDKRRITDQEAAADQEELDKLLKTPFQKNGTPLEQLTANSRLAAARLRCQIVLERYANQDKMPRLPTELHVIRIGDIAFASNRFELFMDFMHRIQARSPFIQTFIVQLAAVPGSDGGTYLATERAAAGKGYSASRYCNLVSPKGGQELVEETVRILKKIHKAE